MKPSLLNIFYDAAVNIFYDAADGSVIGALALAHARTQAKGFRFRAGERRQTKSTSTRSMFYKGQAIRDSQVRDESFFALKLPKM